MQMLQEINAVLKEVATTIIAATTIVGATVALLHKFRGLFRGGRRPQP